VALLLVCCLTFSLFYLLLMGRLLDVVVVGVSMNLKYDILKKIDNSGVWVEAAEDIVAAKKRLISLGSTTPGEYKLWDSSRQEFINPMDECA
jgi:hypothetical protein